MLKIKRLSDPIRSSDCDPEIYFHRSTNKPCQVLGEWEREGLKKEVRIKFLQSGEEFEFEKGLFLANFSDESNASKINQDDKETTRNEEE